MARNGSGTYSLPAGNPVTTGTTISSTWANNTLSDMGTALTQSIAYDGQTTPVANLPMGSNKHTGVGNATVRTNYASAADVQDGSLTYLTSVSGTNTILATGPVGMTAYVTGQVFRFVAAGANTGATTVNINSIGAKAIVKINGSALVSGDIPSGAMVSVAYDGTSFQLQSTVGVTSFSAGATGFTPVSATSGAVTLAGVLGKLNGGTGALTATVSSVARSSNVSTITTAAAHGFVTGDYVTVAAVTNTGFNGNFTITSTPLSTSFTYAQTAANVTATSDTGTVTDLSYVNLVTNVTGILYPNFGGTGVSTIPTGNLITGNATSAVNTVAPSSNGQSLVVTAGTSVTAGAFVIGATYTITSVGSTSFTSIGASANTVGISFTATGVGSGTGTATLNTFATGSSIASGTLVTSASTTSFEFTSIPSWVKKITMMFYNTTVVSTAGIPIAQIGTGATPTWDQTVGDYIGSQDNTTLWNTYKGALIYGSSLASTSTYAGKIIFTNITGNIWNIETNVARTNSASNSAGVGYISLGSALTAVRFTTNTAVNLTGNVNIQYE